MGLAGIMFWAPDLDDFTGSVCNEGKYPLATAAVSLTRNQATWSTSTKAPVTIPRRPTDATTRDGRKRAVCYYTKYANRMFLF